MNYSGATGKVSSQTGKKLKPGLSSIAPVDAAEYLLPLLKDAKKLVPERSRASTPVYVIGTAGMRLLSEAKRDAIFDAAANDLPGLLDKIKAPFRVKRANFRVATGTEEGFWGFLAANYLQRHMGTDLRHRGHVPGFSGVLDLGGSSTQISFTCGYPRFSATRALSDDSVFTHSFLGFGARLARAKAEARVDKKNPCDFKGFTRKVSGRKLKGTGSGVKCRELIKMAVLESESCTDPPCFFNGVHKPVAPCGQFLGISLYYYAMDAVRKVAKKFLQFRSDAPDSVKQFLSEWPRPSVAAMVGTVDVFCDTKWSEVNKKWKHDETPDAEAWSGRCFETNYIVSLISSGFAIENDRGVTFMRDIDGTEVEWTLGAFLKENTHHTSEQDQPEDAGNRVTGWLVFIAIVALVFVVVHVAGKHFRLGSGRRLMSVPMIRMGAEPVGAETKARSPVSRDAKRSAARLEEQTAFLAAV